ncbi:TPA: hypothetical protein ACQUIL_005646 [Bacillus tropicus]
MAYPVKDLKLTLEQVAMGEPIVLTKVDDWYDYDKDGNKEAQAKGLKYTCALDGVDFEKIIVKVPYERGALHITPEELEAKKSQVDNKGKKMKMYVDFEGFEASVYAKMSGNRAMADLSCKATSIFEYEDVVIESDPTDDWPEN